jgi:hypothetical protein
VKGSNQCMNRRSGFQIICLAAISLLCIILTSVMVQVRASHALSKKKPVVELRASRILITYTCQPGWRSISGSCPSQLDPGVRLTALAPGFGKQSVYRYSVTAGQIVGEGSEVTWDLSSVGPGDYTATVEVKDSKNHQAVTSANVRIVHCSDCIDHPEWGCPAFAVDCYDKVKAGTALTCKVVIGKAPLNRITYEWSARDSSDEDLSERIRRHGEYISIPTDDLAGRTVYVRVDLKGLDPSCSSAASHSTKVQP